MFAPWESQLQSTERTDRDRSCNLGEIRGADGSTTRRGGVGVRRRTLCRAVRDHGARADL